MAHDTDSIFAHGAVIVPDFVTPAEETRILLRIAGAPWLTELRRRVQHYGFRYSYRGTARPVPAAPFPRWAANVRIPEQSDHSFHGKVITDSTAK